MWKIVVSYVVITALNDLNEESWPVLDWAREYLKQVSIVVVVNEDVELLELFVVSKSSLASEMTESGEMIETYHREILGHLDL